MFEKLPLWYLLLHNCAGKIRRDREYYNDDLVMINGVFNGIKYDDEVALLLNTGHHFTRVCVIDIWATAFRYTKYKIKCNYQCLKIPIKMVRAFAIKQPKSSNESRSTRRNRGEIKLICEAMVSITNDFRYSPDADLCHSFTHLTFGIISKKFGIQGFNCAFTDLILELPDSAITTRRIFHRFYQKYYRAKHRSLANSAVANGVKTGDLVQITELKPQKNESLQIRAGHFGGSFGEITTFSSGVLMRGNSRNQTEFAVQSLFDKSMKLALRPKYSCKITKIYVHRIAQDVSFEEFQQFVVPLFKSKSSRILYLPLRDMDDGSIGCPMTQIAVFMLQNQNKSQMLFDVAVSSFIPILEELPKISELAHEILSFPFYLGEEMWENVKGWMRVNATAANGKRLQKLDKIVCKLNDKFMKLELPRELPKELEHWTNHIEFELRKLEYRQNHKFFIKLFGKIRIEMLAMIRGLHPDYFKLYDSKGIGVYGMLRNLYRVSVIQNYLKANSKGCDLHVIYYADGMELLQNVSSALSDKINVEWNIRNSNVSHILAGKIIQ